MKNEPTATYTKLRDGSWGIRVVGPKPSLNDTVFVTKKSGQTELKMVGRVLWSGGNVHVCTLVAERTTSYSRRGSGGCGYPCPVDGHICTGDRPCHDCI